MPCEALIVESWVSLSFESPHFYGIKHFLETYLDKHRCDKNYSTFLKKHLLNVYFDFLVWSMSRPLKMEEAGFMTYTAASHQGAIEMIWLHFYGAVTSSIFIYHFCKGGYDFVSLFNIAKSGVFQHFPCFFRIIHGSWWKNKKRWLILMINPDLVIINVVS